MDHGIPYGTSGNRDNNQARQPKYGNQTLYSIIGMKPVLNIVTILIGIDNAAIES